mgnify:CR=1 FL=1
MELVKCENQHWDFILSLRNEVRKGFIQQHKILSGEHEKFMQQNEGNYFICLDQGIPVGFIGDVGQDIRIAVSPRYQNKGVGKFMLNSFLNIQTSSIAKVKIDNKESLKLFESCGFKKKYYILEKE